MNRCADFVVSGLEVTAQASGDYFVSSEVGAVTSLSAVYADSADDAFRRFADQTLECIRAERDPANWTGPLRPENVKVREISLPNVGESRRAYQIEWELGGLPSYDDVVIVQKGRTVTVVYLDPTFGCLDEECASTPNQEAPFLRRTVVELARAAAARM